MWKLTTCYDGGRDPFLSTLNGHIGRQVWVFDESAGSPSELAEVEKLRKTFTEKRHVQRHSSDELLRLQKIDKSKVWGMWACNVHDASHRNTGRQG